MVKLAFYHGLLLIERYRSFTTRVELGLGADYGLELLEVCSYILSGSTVYSCCLNTNIRVKVLQVTDCRSMYGKRTAFWLITFTVEIQLFWYVWILLCIYCLSRRFTFLCRYPNHETISHPHYLRYMRIPISLLYLFVIITLSLLYPLFIIPNSLPYQVVILRYPISFYTRFIMILIFLWYPMNKNIFFHLRFYFLYIPICSHL